MSPFAALLVEGQTLLRVRCRRDVGMHFDWDGSDRKDSWKAWCDDPTVAHPDGVKGAYAVFTGCAGEQALRHLVDALRARDGGAPLPEP